MVHRIGWALVLASACAITSAPDQLTSVGGGAAFTLMPSDVNLPPGSVQKFTASEPASFEIVEGQGSVDASGAFTAPLVAGILHVRAKSLADPSRTATSKVTVSSQPVVSVTVDPPSASLTPGATQRFTAQVSGAGDHSVVWNVRETAGGGVSDDGLYTAPGVAGVYHVVATSRADPSKSAAAAIAVALPPSAVTIVIDPLVAVVPAGQTARFTALVSGTPNSGVTWSAPDGGSVDSAGFFLAPRTAGTVRVVATSLADPSKSATAQVQVTALPQISIAVAPSELKLAPGATQALSATVTGTSDTGVLWSVQEAGGGTVDAFGRYQAPGATGTFHVVASAHADPSRRAIATVTVAAPQRAILISPPAITLQHLATIQFTATITGLADRRVHFWVDGVGPSLNPDTGAFTAPAYDGIWHVGVASIADPTLQATATVTVASAGGISVVIDPAQIRLTPGSQARFVAHVNGTADGASTLSVQEPNGGAIDANGLYQSPANLEGVFHVVATSHADPSKTAVATVTVSWNDLVDHGGRIAPHLNAYTLWWGPPADFPADMKAGIELLLGTIDGSPYLAIADQYMRGEKTSLRFAGSFADPSPPPSSLPGIAELTTALCAQLAAAGQKPDPNGLYFVQTSNFPGAAAATFCGWHSWSSCAGVPILLAFVPNLAGTKCDAVIGQQCNSLSSGTQSMASVVAHELMETITDPTGSGWTDSAGSTGEIGDKCAWKFDSACVQLGAQGWQIQQEWSNAVHACVAK